MHAMPYRRGSNRFRAKSPYGLNFRDDHLEFARDSPRAIAKSHVFGDGMLGESDARNEGLALFYQSSSSLPPRIGQGGGSACLLSQFSPSSVIRTDAS